MTIAKEPDSPISSISYSNQRPNVEPSAHLGFPPLLPNELFSDEPPLETELHLEQMMLLIKCLLWLWRDRMDFYAVGNLTIYFSPLQLKSEDFRGPDFFVVLDTERKTRKSWVVWEENYKYPNVIVEVISLSTAKVDKGLKKEIYQNTFRTPEYFWYDPYKPELVGFRLKNGKYQRIRPNKRGHLWSEQLGLYLGIHEKLTRFFHPGGELVPTLEESLAQSEELAIQSKERVIVLEQRTAQETLMRELAEQRAIQSEERAAQETLMRELAEQRTAQETLMRELAEQRADREALMRELAEQRTAQEVAKMEIIAAKLRELNIDIDLL
jgi:Uma2 family endonuclease